jgi:hypothetical protein
MTLAVCENSLDKSKLFVARARQGIIPSLDAKSMEGKQVNLILLLTMFVLAVSLASCSQKRKDFETAKTAVAQELRSPDTAQFCTVDQAEFWTRNGAQGRAVRLWVDNRNLAGVLVRTHFEVTIDPKSGLVKGVTCLECAAEDEKQKLNEAVAELQGLTSPSGKASTTPVP